MRRAQTTTQTKAGFTLIEMMVALTAGAIAVSTIYMVSAASTRHFYEQQNVAHLQTALRIAAERVRKDVARAGFMASGASGHQVGGCDSEGKYGDTQIQAVEIDDAEGNDVLTEQATNLVEADAILLVGNYATADEYRGQMTDASTVWLGLDTNEPGFRRSFGTVPGTYSEDVFVSVFRDDRFVRLVDDVGNTSFHRIAGQDGTAMTITISPPTGGTGFGGSPCSGTGSNVSVAPIMKLEYRADTFNTGSGEKFAGSADLATQQDDAPALIRQEQDMDQNYTPYDDNLQEADTEQVILEYLADFDVDFVMDIRAGRDPINKTSLDPADRPNLVLHDEVINGDQTETLETVLANDTATTDARAVGPHRARAAIIRLSVRSSSESQKFPFVARGSADDPLLRYELDPNVLGAARVRTLTQEVMLTNVAAQNLR